MKHLFLCILFLLVCKHSFTQFQVIPTTTTQVLNTLSVIDNNIMIGGKNGYLIKSTDECNHITNITAPPFTSGWTEFQRLDSNLIFLYAEYGSSTLVYKSTNGGITWIEKLNTDTILGEKLVMFDSLEGILFGFPYTRLRTKDGGDTWTQEINPFYYPDAVGKYGDSTICVGNTSGVGITHDRGYTWNFVSLHTSAPTFVRKCIYVNNDTLLLLADDNSYRQISAISTDGGYNWIKTIIPVSLNIFLYDFVEKNISEQYFVGVSQSNNHGIIYKTLDGGNSWSIFDSGIPAIFTRINFINDSIALITGTNGTAVKWNKNSIPTGLQEIDMSNNEFSVYPNPVSTTIDVRCSMYDNRDTTIEMYNSKGQLIITSKIEHQKSKIDVSKFSRGIYYLKVGNVSKKVVVE